MQNNWLADYPINIYLAVSYNSFLVDNWIFKI